MIDLRYCSPVPMGGLFRTTIQLTTNDAVNDVCCITATNQQTALCRVILQNRISKPLHEP